MSLLEKLDQNKKNNAKGFAVLLDPDKAPSTQIKKVLRLSRKNNVDFFFVGGSLITSNTLTRLIAQVKAESDIPIILFPGNSLHIDNQADAILFLSLISGRNPEYLIGQHVIAAPLLKESGLEILPTGYILVDCGKPTTVSYISNTIPIPYDKPAVAACTALAGEMLGLKLIYLDGGSGAAKPVSPEMVSEVRNITSTPLIVGGGIHSAETAAEAWKAGADLVVVGNGVENNPELIPSINTKRSGLYNQ